MERVVAVGDQAWTLDLVRGKGLIEAGDLTIRWRPGRASALGPRRIAAGEDIGSVTVQRRDGDRLRDVAHVNPFAFAFRAFTPNGAIHGSTARFDGERPATSRPIANNALRR